MAVKRHLFDLRLLGFNSKLSSPSQMSPPHPVFILSPLSLHVKQNHVWMTERICLCHRASQIQWDCFITTIFHSTMKNNTLPEKFCSPILFPATGFFSILLRARRVELIVWRIEEWVAWLLQWHSSGPGWASPARIGDLYWTPRS